MTSLSCTQERAYAVSLQRGLCDPERSDLALAIGERRVLVISSPTVARHHGTSLRTYLERWEVDAAFEVVPLDERNKTMDAALRVCAFAQRHHMGRRDLFMAFGGGVVTDVVSVAASLYRRGVPCLRLPTSLIGQVDAGIGVKSAVNANGRKSALGAFSPPEHVICDPSWLGTLAPRAVRSGIAEIIKIALLRDAELFETVERHAGTCVEMVRSGRHGLDAVLRRAIDLMLEELQSDPFETCLERLVDFGHTFSPTIEITSAHACTHGEAVAIDMALSVAISRRLGLLSTDGARRAIGALRRVGLPTDSVLLDPELLAAAADDCVAHRGGSLNLVLLEDIGRPVFLRDRSDLTDELLTTARADLAELGAPPPCSEAVLMSSKESVGPW